MNNEIEATFRNIDKDEVRARLKAANAKLIKPEFLQKRHVFYLPKSYTNMPEKPKIIEEDGSYFILFNNHKLRTSSIKDTNSLIDTIYSSEVRASQNTGWLRVRDEDDRITLTYKRQESSNIDGMREIEVIIDNYETAVQLLEFLGCEFKAYQETLRELWEFNGVDIMIDTWPYLDPFVEVEGESEQDVKKVSSELGFAWRDAYFGAVDEIYADEFGVSAQTVNEAPRLVFEEHPEGYNPFERTNERN